MDGVREDGGYHVSSRVLRDTRVVFASICCIKKLLNSLDSCSGGGVAEGGADFVISKFSLAEVLKNPAALLDALILYLFIVHNIDWHGSTWMRTTTLTTTEEAKEGWGEGGSDIDHDEQVSKVIEDLRLRTDNFLEKVQKIYNLMLTNRFGTGYIFTQLHITQELVTEESRISTDQ